MKIGKLPGRVPTRQERQVIRETALTAIILGDLVFLFLGQVLGFLFRFQWGPLPEFLVTTPHEPLNYLGHFILGTILGISILGGLGIYQSDALLRLRRSPLVLAKGVTYWALCYLLITLFVRFQPEVSRIYVFLSFLITFVLLAGWRWLVHEWMNTREWREGLRERVLIVGGGRYVQDLVHAIHSDPHHPYQLVGMALTDSSAGGKENGDDLILCRGIEDLHHQIGELLPDIVVLGDTRLEEEETQNLSELCAREMIRFKTIPTQFQIHLSGLTVSTISGIPVLGVDVMPIDRPINRFLKRLCDLAGAGLGLLVSVPIILILGLMIWRESPGPVFYGQTRSGRRGVPFTMWKLRSMHPEAEQEQAGWTVANDPRTLRIGRMMRCWNMDELPQFWNVLMGEMSLVGPRPERPELIEKFKHEIRFYNLRHDIKPGMSGWAQINGLRGDTDLEERLRYDFYYVENWSLWLDLYIMLMTLFRYKNAY